MAPLALMHLIQAIVAIELCVALPLDQGPANRDQPILANAPPAERSNQLLPSVAKQS